MESLILIYRCNRQIRKCCFSNRFSNFYKSIIEWWTNQQTDGPTNKRTCPLIEMQLPHLIRSKRPHFQKNHSSCLCFCLTSAFSQLFLLLIVTFRRNFLPALEIMVPKGNVLSRFANYSIFTNLLSNHSKTIRKQLEKRPRDYLPTTLRSFFLLGLL